MSLAETDAVSCANCKNCDISCPHGVDVSNINMLARAEYCREHRPSFRDWILAHGELEAKLVRYLPSFIANVGQANPITKLVLSQIGISPKADLPKFAPKQFPDLFKAYKQPENLKKKVVFYPGCFVKAYAPQVGMDFVKLMNEKAAEMGLTSTHFENPTGLFHPDHKSTAREIASIMAYAMNMKLCRKVMLTQSYNAPCVGADGKVFSYNLYHSLIVTQFDRIPVNQPDTVKVAAAKTGFTDESRFCLVTYAESADGHGYVCVTAKGDSYNACIADYITIYNTYAKP